MTLTATHNKIRSIIIESVSMLLIFLFVYAAVSKIIDHKSFLYALGKSPILSPYGKIISWTVPLFEIIVAVLLAIPKSRKLGLLYSSLLMVGFTSYILYMIVFIPQLPCSCGGVLKGMGWNEHLAFNICFTLLAFTGWLLLKRRKFLLQ